MALQNVGEAQIRTECGCKGEHSCFTCGISQFHISARKWLS